jgi:type IV pilus assembly protein PilE
MTHHTRQRGITLIELMVVVVIVAVLTSIAVPSYRAYMVRAHRTEAKSALLSLAAAQEKFYLQNNRYAEDDELTAAPPAGLGLPDTTENGWYTIEIGAADGEGFAATATAAGTQVQDTHCAELSINQAGVRGATNDDCW